MAEQKTTKAKNEENGEVKKPMPAGLPYLAAGGVFFVLSFIFNVYEILWLLVTAVIALAVGVFLGSKRRKQLAAMPKPTPVKLRADELSRKLDDGRDELRSMKTQIGSQAVSAKVESMACTLEKLADNLEKNPKDRSKIRKVAVHYVPMIVDLVKNYINLEQQGTDGANITASMASIEDGLEKVDESLKQYLDDMFEDDKMSIETDIEVLKQLMNKDAANVNKMNFDDILNEMNGGKE